MGRPEITPLKRQTTVDSRRRTRRRVFGLGLPILLLSSPYLVGTVLILPRNGPVGTPPPDLHATNVTFPSASGTTIHGWLVQGRPGIGVVVLMHGVHSSRLSMVPRARYLARQGYSVLLFDFQACGESIGKQVTFGRRESEDAQAAVAYVHQALPAERVGVIGVSMGGAAAVLASPPLPVDALVLESVYPSITEAIHDRIARWLGPAAVAVAPLLIAQIQSRLGFSPDALRPIDGVRAVRAPKLILAGTEDRHTTLAESERFFAAASEPKAFWPVAGAPHTDLYTYAGTLYETRVGDFLARNLSR